MIVNAMRLLLAALLVVGGTAICGTAGGGEVCCSLNACQEDRYDVVIIGAGWAGLAAAAELEAYKTTDPDFSYCILEANTFTGGRSVAAHWISGGEGNPLAEMTWTIPSLNSLTYETQKWSNVQYFDKDGKPVQARVINNLRSAWGKIYECAQQQAIDFQTSQGTIGPTFPSEPSMGMRDAINHCKSIWQPTWNPDPTKGYFSSILEWYDLDYEFLRTPENISFYGFPLGPYEPFQFKDWFVSDKDNCARIARAFAAENGVCEHIQIGKEVCMVQHDASGATIYYTDPGSCPLTCPLPDYSSMDSITADYVIVTTSAGVLDERGDDGGGCPEGRNRRMFDPALSPSKMNALRQVVETINYMEIIFQFSDAIWQKLRAFWSDTQFIAVETEIRDRCNIWQAYETRWDEFFPGSHAMVCVLTTDTIALLGGRDSLAGAGAEGIVNGLLKQSLGKAYKFKHKTDIPNCTRASHLTSSLLDPTNTFGHCRYWAFPDNPYWQGSYMNWKVGGNPVNYTEAYVTHEGRLYFAGESTCDLQWGYMHGAYYSGIREANKVIDAGFQTNPNPTPQFCEVDPRGGPGNIAPPKAG